MKHFLSRLITILFAACTMYAHEAGPSQPRTPQGGHAQPFPSALDVPGVILEEGEPVPPKTDTPEFEASDFEVIVAPEEGPATGGPEVAKADPLNNFRRLIMLTGGMPQTGDDAIFGKILMAIEAETAPILIATDALQGLIKLIKQRYSNTLIQDVDPQAHIAGMTFLELHQSFMQSIKDAAADPRASTPYAPPFSLPFDFFIKYIMTWQLQFNADHWFVFINTNAHPSSFSALLLPKTYVRALLGTDQPLRAVAQEDLLGFQLHNLTYIELPKPDPFPLTRANALNQLNEWDMVSQSIQIALPAKTPQPFSLTMFLKTKNEQSPYSWNIYLAGHGLPSDLIAGMPSRIFLALLNELNTSIATNLFYYSTCFGGSLAHIETIDKIIDQKQSKGLNFTLISQAASDVLTPGGYGMGHMQLHNEKIFLPPNTDFLHFFEGIEREEPFDQILRFEKADQSPLIHYPGINYWFSGVPVEKKKTAQNAPQDLILSKVKLQTAFINNKSITVSPAHRMVVIRYPFIPVPLIIQPYQGEQFAPRFILNIVPTADIKHIDTCYFETVTAPSLESLIFDLTSFYPPPHFWQAKSQTPYQFMFGSPKTYVFNEVVLNNIQSILHNVVICAQETGITFYDGTNQWICDDEIGWYRSNDPHPNYLYDFIDLDIFAVRMREETEGLRKLKPRTTSLQPVVKKHRVALKKSPKSSRKKQIVALAKNDNKAKHTKQST